MSVNYEEIDYQTTPLGDLILRRRRMSQLGDLDIYEVILGDDFLMTSLFHEAEYQLSKLGLNLAIGKDLDVVIGGLGLGYTAMSALEDDRVESLVVVEYLEAVIGWHQKGLVPLGNQLLDDARCKLSHSDFFGDSARTGKGFDPDYPEKKHDVILLDIDHTPTNLLHQTNARFYSAEGLKELRTHLNPRGVFAMWADGVPDESFTQTLNGVFDSAASHTIEFENPITGGTSKGTVYVAQIQT